MEPTIVVRHHRPYKTKYSGMTPEERQAMYNQKSKEWRAAQPRERFNDYFGFYCEDCHRQYTNKYLHIRTKKHIRNALAEKQTQ